MPDIAISSVGKLDFMWSLMVIETLKMFKLGEWHVHMLYGVSRGGTNRKFDYIRKEIYWPLKLKTYLNNKVCARIFYDYYTTNWSLKILPDDMATMSTRIQQYFKGMDIAHRLL